MSIPAPTHRKETRRTRIADDDWSMDREVESLQLEFVPWILTF